MATSRFDLELGGLLGGLRREIRNEDWLESFGKRATEIGQLLAHHREQAEAVASDRDLSPSGREKRLQRLSEQTRAALRAIKQQDLEGYSEHLASLRQRPKKESSPTDAFVAALRGFEIRSYFAQLEPVEREAMYRAWAHAGVDENAVAVESSPIPLLSKEIIAEGQQIRMDRLDPEAAEKIRDLSVLSDSMRMLVSTAEAELQAGTAPDDPLQRVRETGEPRVTDAQPQTSEASGRPHDATH